MEKTRCLQALLENAVRKICETELHFKSKVRAQCLLALTLDEAEVVLVQVDEVLLEKRVALNCRHSENLRGSSVGDAVLQPFFFHSHTSASLNASSTSAIEPDNSGQYTSYGGGHLVQDNCHESSCGGLDLRNSNDDSILGTVVIESYGNYESMSTEVKAELVNQWPCELVNCQAMLPINSDVHHSMPVDFCHYVKNDSAVSEAGVAQSKSTSANQMNLTQIMPATKPRPRSSACDTDRKIENVKQVLVKHKLGLPRTRKAKLFRSDALSLRQTEIKRKRGRPKNTKTSLWRDGAPFTEKYMTVPRIYSKKSLNTSRVAVRKIELKRGRSQKKSLVLHDAQLFTTKDHVMQKLGLHKKSVVSEDATSFSIKRKRGRPKKSLIMNSSASSFSELSSPVKELKIEIAKMPIGLDRSSLIEAGAAMSPVAAITISQGQLQEKAIDASASMTNVEIATQPIKVTQKRGRPKKSLVMNSSASFSSTLSSPVKELKIEIAKMPIGLGRSSSIEAGVSMSPVAAITISQGQLQEKVIDASASKTKVEIATQPIKVKRKRGRPKKSLIPEDAKLSFFKRRYQKKHLIVNSFGTSTLVKKVKVKVPETPIKVLPSVIDVGVPAAPAEYAEGQPKNSLFVDDTVSPMIGVEAAAQPSKAKRRLGRPRKSLIDQDDKLCLITQGQSQNNCLIVEDLKKTLFKQKRGRPKKIPFFDVIGASQVFCQDGLESRVSAQEKKHP